MDIITKVVFTNGCFDILHEGHIKLLTECKRLGDVIVGLNSDFSVRKLKGDDRPVNNQEKRKEALKATGLVDVVIIFYDETPFDLILAIQPDYLVKGGDYKEDDIIGSDFVKSYGGHVVIVPLVEGFSTTKIIKKI